MTHQQISDSIRLGWPFFGIASNGAVLARYIPFGPVFIWKRNQMIPAPLQGDDLLWWMQASDEVDSEE